MANSKRQCKGCNRYLRQDKHEWRKAPAGWFHTFDCLLSFTRKKSKEQATEKKKAHKVAKQKLKGLNYWIKETKLVAQEYAARRDGGRPCISCGMYFHETNNGFLTRFDGGHFKSVGGHADMQLNLNNIHGQCRRCNGFQGGRPKEYELGLIDRYGVEFVDRLNGPQTKDKWTMGYLERYRAAFRKRMKRWIK